MQESQIKQDMRELSSLIDELYSMTEPHTQTESQLYLEIGEMWSKIWREI